MYIVKRNPICYTNGRQSDVLYLKDLSIVAFLTTNPKEAQLFPTKAKAMNTAQRLGKNWCAVKMSNE